MQPDQKKTKTRRKAGQSTVLDVAICSALRVENARQGERILMHYWLQKRRNAEKRVAYNRGYCAGRRLHRKAAERASYYNALPHGATAQELAEISHEHRR